MVLPEVTTPEALAKHLGWPARRVRRIARALGACLVSGDAMTLTEADVLKIMESQRCRSSSTSAAVSGITGAQLALLSADRASEALATPRTKILRRVRLPKSKPATGKVISMVRQQS